MPAVCLRPSLAEIETSFLRAVDDMVVAVRSINTMDADLMSLLHLEPQQLFNIGADDPLHADLDGKLDSARATIREHIAVASAGPQRLVERYEEFAWLLSLDTALFVREFVETEPELNEYVGKVREFEHAARSIEATSENNELFVLLDVDTTLAKARLRSKALELRNALIQHMIRSARTQNEATNARYEQILARLAEKPSNEAELASLKNFIQTSKDEVLAMVTEVEKMHRRLATLDEFSYALPADDIHLAWSTMEYPRRVHDAAYDTETRIEMDKVRMMDKLAIEKNRFDELLDQFEVDVKRAKALTDYDNEGPCVEEINTLQDAIVEAQKRAQNFNEREKVFGFPPTEYAALDAVFTELAPYYSLWNMISSSTPTCRSGCTVHSSTSTARPSSVRSKIGGARRTS